MKYLILVFFYLTSQSVLMGQLVPYLWTEDLKLQKSQYAWVERNINIIEKQNGSEKQYPVSKVIIDKNANRVITLYNTDGTISEVNNVYWEDEFVEVYEMQDGNKEVTRYDKNNNITSVIWIYPDGSKDGKEYTYEENRLVRISEYDDFGTAIEELKYSDNKLSEIISLDEDGNELMKRKIIYNALGNIEETQRIQEGIINKKVFYSYDDSNRIINKEEEKINRLNGKKMPPEIYTYEYFEDGLLEQESWIIYLDESRAEKKFEFVSTYNKEGLIIKEIGIDYEEESEETTNYEYKK